MHWEPKRSPRTTCLDFTARPPIVTRFVLLSRAQNTYTDGETATAAEPGEPSRSHVDALHVGTIRVHGYTGRARRSEIVISNLDCVSGGGGFDGPACVRILRRRPTRIECVAFIHSVYETYGRAMRATCYYADSIGNKRVNNTRETKKKKIPCRIAAVCIHLRTHD